MRIKNTNIIKRIIAIALLLCIVSVFSLLIVHAYEHTCAEHAHEQVGADCSLCVHIGNAIKTICKFVLAIFTALFASLALTASYSPVKRVLHEGNSTPVSLKLRMNN